MSADLSKYCLIPGATLGNKYQIIKLIGQGGMGVVHLAYDLMLDINVAIKLISPELSQTMETDQFEGIIRRFESEARIAAKIDHPNVIRIYGFNRETIDIHHKAYDIDYLVMELLSGRTVRNTMDVSGFETEEEIRHWIQKYYLPMLEGIQEVHDCGIIHRDIKPENFFLKDDAPKLADFGLSLGHDIPSVTGSAADVFGTMIYMAPEQYYNFSLARETADIYSIGKILFESIEGKISERAIPFKQAKLSNSDTDLLSGLDAIIRAATEENPAHRIGSIRELKENILKTIYCRAGGAANSRRDKNKNEPRKIAAFWTVFLLLVTAIGVLTGRYVFKDPNWVLRPQAAVDSSSTEGSRVTYQPHKIMVEKSRRAEDGSTLHFIPPAVLELEAENALGMRRTELKPFYVAESPVTNQQYVRFLNKNIDRIEVKESEVYLEGKLVLKLSEKIRGYKPIVYENDAFDVKNPMHSACAVLMVSGFGADAYASHYGLRLITASEWYLLNSISGDTDGKRLSLPTPVVNYSPDKFGVRGINQVAEWGKAFADQYLILGEMPSDMVDGEPINRKHPFKYYTDTSFRVAKNVSFR